MESVLRDDGAYGHRLADAFKVHSATSFITRTKLQNSKIAATHIKANVADNTLTAPVENEDAVLIMLQLRDWPKRILWADDKPVAANPLKAGAISIFDLRTKWVGNRVCPIEQIHFYLPRESLDEISDIEGRPRTQHFDNDPLVGSDDMTVWRLGLALRPAFERPKEANQLFIDHATSAIAAHLLNTYGARQPIDETVRDFGHWREARAKEIITSELGGNVTIAELAKECGLSISTFNRAFQQSAGMMPHQWLLERRVEKAMHLLCCSTLPPHAIATASGFFDLRHFTRVFTGMTGVRPGAWRDLKRN